MGEREAIEEGRRQAERALEYRRSRRSSAGVIVALLAAGTLDCASAGDPLEPAGVSPTTRSAAREAVASGRVPSLSYAVLRDGEIQESQTLGFADLETGERASETTLYEAASLTKPVVALLALQLLDAGVIELDESVAKVVPAPRIRDRERYARVTPRQLLSHSAGFPNWSGSSLDLGRTDPVDFEFDPGTGFSYSGEGYGILGEFLERKSGDSLEVLSAELFRALGMSASSLVGAGVSGPVARGHFGRSPSRAARRLARPVPAYSMLTNAAEYGRFLAFVAAGAGLKAETLAEARRVQIDVPPSCLRGPRGPHRLGWSLGWGVLQRGDEPIYFQWGDNGAFRALAAFQVPRTQAPKGLVFFANGSLGLLESDALASPVLGDLSAATGWFSSRPLEVLRRWARF